MSRVTEKMGMYEAMEILESHGYTVSSLGNEEILQMVEELLSGSSYYGDDESDRDEADD